MRSKVTLLLFSCTFAALAADQFYLTQSTITLSPGQKVTIHARALPAATTPKSPAPAAADPPADPGGSGPADPAALPAPATPPADPNVDWTITPNIPGAALTGFPSGSVLTYTAPEKQPNGCVQVALTATKGKETHTVYLLLARDTIAEAHEPCPGAMIVMSVIGFEQAGGTSAKSQQRFFFDIFDSRPLPFGTNDDSDGPGTRWWSSIRIASYPQQVTTSVAQFASTFATQVGNLPVNQLASFGEFRAGLEQRIAKSQRNYLPAVGSAEEKTSFGVIGYFGGLANLDAPSDHVDVFTIPAPGTPQRAAFDSVFPQSKYPILALPGTQYIGLTTPDHDRFYWQYGLGFRMTTRFFDPDGTLLAAPAMFSASFGQNELVTGGARRGVVGSFEAFYPLPLGLRGKNANLIYLFGRADLRLGKPNVGNAPLVLNPAVDSQNNAIPPTNPAVAIVALPSNRDLYTIGAGIDAVQLINAIGSAVKGK